MGMKSDGQSTSRLASLYNHKKLDTYLVVGIVVGSALLALIALGRAM